MGDSARGAVLMTRRDVVLQKLAALAAVAVILLIVAAVGVAVMWLRA